MILAVIILRIRGTSTSSTGIEIYERSLKGLQLFYVDISLIYQLAT